MKQILKVTILISIFIFNNYFVTAQQKNNFKLKIDSLLNLTYPRAFNGAVYIQQNGKLKYAKAFGIADTNKKTLLKINDNFSTMSIAKQFTATLILLEVEKGTIDLHIPIRTYLPDLKYSWADTITVHQLLNNTSGLTTDDINKPLKFKPGTAFNYSNLGYYVAGMVLEKQSGNSFETLITALFNKYNMRNSYYPTENSSALLSKGHLVSKNGETKQFEKISFTPDKFWGSHLIVTVSDLAKWNECLHNKNILKPNTYKLMTSYTITNKHQLFSENPIGYGYGLRINDTAEIFELGHTGFHPSEGFTAVNLYYPKSKTSVIVMENQAHENFEIAYFFEQEIRKIVKKLIH
jgi:D-alanyl-D-alanine carboxypeptidase